jgi:hypothetical protein
MGPRHIRKFLRISRFKNNLNPFTFEVELVFNYYKYLNFAKVPNSTSLPHKSFMASCYILPRFVAFCKVIYLLGLWYGMFERIHGPLESFDYVEIYMWGLACFVCTGNDLMWQSSDFIRSVHHSFRLWNQVWNKIHDANPSEAFRILNNLRRSILRFTMHSLYVI